MVDAGMSNPLRFILADRPLGELADRPLGELADRPLGELADRALGELANRALGRGSQIAITASLFGRLSGLLDCAGVESFEFKILNVDVFAELG